MKTAIMLSTLLAVAIGAPAPQHALSKRQGQNFQTFTGALGGIAATPITDSGNADRKFQVKGDTFVNIGAALQRSCDQQFNACANKANGGDRTLSVSACADQKTQCDAAGQGNTGAANAQAAANSTAAATASGTAAAAVPCDQASNAASGASATATAIAAAASSKPVAAKDPCDTAAASAESNAGKAKKNNGGARKEEGKNKNGTGVSANPCDKKSGAAKKRSVAVRRITRRYRVAY
ncbi:hypothetical protein BU23DRAFT_559000 [Bimuria novae-zelandiae CBS 107.79]|uniref:Uncharacterized protein n=1 Tax=Bimuria novae-zelandiae CBS 107.79 TaxID=1447943 RepID=A0A6A5UT10_9PLEO|nr:hypothetical protein BU23DRAFT_559000 [Bimuria novae-zelandiae CBS 107.79]